MTAAIATATLIDFGIISSDDKQFVVDRNKVARHRNKLRKLQVQNNDIQTLYFGRRDVTKVYTNNTMNTMKEEHISFVEQPGSLFIGHKTIKNGDADTIVTAIETLMEEKSIPKELIKGLGCDGPKVNIGENGGVIRKIELKWNQPLQWIICGVHSNKLPLRALLQISKGSNKRSKHLKWTDRVTSGRM